MRENIYEGPIFGLTIGIPYGAPEGDGLLAFLPHQCDEWQLCHPYYAYFCDLPRNDFTAREALVALIGEAQAALQALDEAEGR